MPTYEITKTGAREWSVWKGDRRVHVAKTRKSCRRYCARHAAAPPRASRGPGAG